MSAKQRRQLSLALVVCLIPGVASAVAWLPVPNKPGRIYNSSTQVTQVDVGLDAGGKPYIALSVVEPTIQNGTCPGAGAIYIDPADALAKAFHAMLLTAFTSNLKVYVEATCNVGLGRQDLREIQLTK